LTGKLSGIEMDSARWDRIQTLFHEAADLPERQRRNFLQDACQDDNGLVADVFALLEEDSLADHSWTGT
jgi:hypothetical protein